MEREIINKNIDLIDKKLSDIQSISQNLKNARDDFEISIHNMIQSLPENISLDTINSVNDKCNNIINQVNKIINKAFLIELKLKAIKKTNNRKQFDKNQKEIDQLYGELGNLSKNIDLD